MVPVSESARGRSELGCPWGRQFSLLERASTPVSATRASRSLGGQPGVAPAGTAHPVEERALGSATQRGQARARSAAPVWPLVHTLGVAGERHALKATGRTAFFPGVCSEPGCAGTRAGRPGDARKHPARRTWPRQDGRWAPRRPVLFPLLSPVPEEGEQASQPVHHPLYLTYRGVAGGPGEQRGRVPLRGRGGAALLGKLVSCSHGAGRALADLLYQLLVRQAVEAIDGQV